MKKNTLWYSFEKGNDEELLTREFQLSMARKLSERLRRGFIKTYRPVMDDAPYRIFDSLGDYCRWCEKELPGWLGYGKAPKGI